MMGECVVWDESGVCKKDVSERSKPCRVVFIRTMDEKKNYLIREAWARFSIQFMM
jgi:hypothetical protein